LAEINMQSTWYTYDSECALQGLVREPFWPGVQRLFAEGEMELARDLLEALRLVVENRPRWRYSRAEQYMEALELHLVQMPWLLGDGRGLGIERNDSDSPMEQLITAYPLRASRRLVAAA
jgi:hypothetical protein